MWMDDGRAKQIVEVVGCLTGVDLTKPAASNGKPHKKKKPTTTAVFNALGI